MQSTYLVIKILPFNTLITAVLQGAGQGESMLCREQLKQLWIKAIMGLENLKHFVSLNTSIYHEMVL